MKPGIWRRPPCVFCGHRIEATADAQRCPMFIAGARVWACRACYEQRRQGVVV